MAKVRADAAKYAETVSNAQRERAATEKYLTDQMAAVQAKSRERDTEILRARASGNEELARELEAQQRIARLSAEIFEASRKEGMRRAELEALAGCKIGSAITFDFTNQTVLYVYDNCQSVYIYAQRNFQHIFHAQHSYSHRLKMVNIFA